MRKPISKDMVMKIAANRALKGKILRNVELAGVQLWECPLLKLAASQIPCGTNYKCWYLRCEAVEKVPNPYAGWNFDICCRDSR